MIVIIMVVVKIIINYILLTAKGYNIVVIGAALVIVLALEMIIIDFKTAYGFSVKEQNLLILINKVIAWR